MGFLPPLVHLFFKTGVDNLRHFCSNFWELIQAKVKFLTEISQVKLQRQYVPPPPWKPAFPFPIRGDDWRLNNVCVGVQPCWVTVDCSNSSFISSFTTKDRFFPLPFLSFLSWHVGLNFAWTPA